MPPSRQIALFGGSFDPVHEGHLEIATKAVDQLNLDQLIFLPCRQSPLKDRPPGASDEDRLTMLRLVAPLVPGASVDDFELRRPPPSYSWETVAHFKSRLPEGTRIYLLIGEDQWDRLGEWRKVDFLRRHVIFIVVGREARPKSRPGFEARFLEGDHPASSSEIRDRLRAGRPPRWLPEPVATHIAKKGLYFGAP